ncbi:cadherin domain-containing protein [Ditylenchus destructor]|uniref:Cadherin domain-containing protein n=1 Tax=Ditylenchus destructor TaxID=166010 RepID=A0AAD4MXK3_9BILA|nr:cadherin domain-containing protein [Ditylenchus destructor]
MSLRDILLADCCYLLATLKGTLITTLPLLDGTVVENGGKIKLELLRGSEYVVLDARSKQLLLRKAIDRDMGMNKFEAVVQCSTIGANDSHNTNVNITTFVFVSDVNDNAPRFSHSEFLVKIPEELPIGTIVPLEFEAVDDDQHGPNSFVHYRIVNIKSALTAHNLKPSPILETVLRIPDSHIPRLVIGNRIDFESIQAFEVEVLAEDSGKLPLSSRAKIHVQVLDVDDLDPQFDFEFYTANISSSQRLHILPRPIFAKDADSFNQSLAYSLSGNHSDKFLIDNHTGEVHFIGRIEDLPTSEVILIVHAQQIDRPERRSQTVLIVQHNETVSKFTDSEPYSSYFIQVSSNFQLAADKSTNQDDIPFSFDNTAAALVVDGNLLEPEYNFTLIGQKHLKDVSIHMRIQVHSSRGARPEFDLDEYLFEFDPENGKIIGQINAKVYITPCEDRNLAEQTCALFYSLLNANSNFVLDTYDGTLSIKNVEDLNAQFPIELIAMVEDVQGQRNFVRILVNGVHSDRRKISLSVILGVLCFLSFVGNAVLITVLFGRKEASNNYITMGTGRRRQPSTSHLWAGNACLEAGDVTITSNALAHITDTDSFSTLSLSGRSNLTAKF